MSTRLACSLAGIALLVLAGTASRAVAAGHAAPALVKAAPAQILVTAQGRTLYLYTRDTHDTSVCTGACATYWPPLLVPPGLTKAPSVAGVGGTFGLTTRADGKRQVTYDGAPLYTFVKDKKAGDMTGQGALGGTWWVVVATTAPAPSAPPATPTPGHGYGY